VTPDGERTMNTFLGASVSFTPADLDPSLIEQASIVYLEGYLFDRTEAKDAFKEAARLARKSGAKVGLTLSDAFCVDRHRDDFRKLIREGTDIVFANEKEITSLYEVNSFAEAADAALADCELDDVADRLMNELSGGERQRVVLARALATGAQTLLLDEPTANLDIAHQAMMFRLVRERCKTNNASAVVITHDLNLAAAFADRVLLLKDGKMFAIGPPRDVLTEENIAAVFGVKVLLDENPVSRNVRVTALF